MTEDEAFIRAVVDSPGDDTPRLVYADWLDDRADPRGPYLRAECEWAKPWRSGERPPDSPELRALSAGLDPVWVARVTRPPLGVCCDHFIMEEQGPWSSEAEIAELERELGITLPTEYRAFLLNYNGGHPYPTGVWFEKAPVYVTNGRYWFYPVSSSPTGGVRGTLRHEIGHYRTTSLPRFFLREPYDATPEEVQWYWDFIPISDEPDDIFTTLLGIRGPYTGVVGAVDWSVEPVRFTQRGYTPLGFTEFLARFQPPAAFDAPDEGRDDWDEQELPPGTVDPPPGGSEAIPF